MEILRLSSSELEQYMKCLKTVFQDARLLDANCTDYRMVNKEGKLGEHMYNCFKIWNRNSRCENCISRKVFQEKTIAHKFELLDDEIYIVFAKYIEVDGEGRVLEMLCHVTNDMIKNGDVDFPIREAIKHTNREIYEDVQGDLGKGLVFRRKGFSVINRRSLFLFEIDKTCNEHILAVPATGEEIYFEIYGVDTDGNILPLVTREL